MRSISCPLRVVVTVATLAFLAATAVSAKDQDEEGDEPRKSRPAVHQPSLKQQSSPQMRSAQGDCVREANRRGYSVLETGNFQQSRDGWSIDLRVRDMRGRITQGSCFVETRTGDVNLYGFGWGYDDEGDDRMEFSCSSVDSRYRECQLPIRGRVQLVRQVSDARCVLGESWGQRGDRIWVDRGCRARFEVARQGSGGGYGSNTLDCNSDNGRYRECQIGPGHFGRLVREYSNGRCRRDATWGTRNGVIWVTDGCRGRFERQRGNSGNVGGGGDAYVECRSVDGRYNECRIGANDGVRLVREYSNDRCRKASTWGTRGDTLWVTNGCSGQFERVRSGGGGDDGGGQAGSVVSLAERACNDEAQRQGYAVVEHSKAFPLQGTWRVQMKVRLPTGKNRQASCIYFPGNREVRIDL